MRAFRAFWRAVVVVLLETARAVFNIVAQSYGARKLYKTLFCKRCGAPTGRAERVNFGLWGCWKPRFQCPHKTKLYKMMLAFCLIFARPSKADGALRRIFKARQMHARAERKQTKRKEGKHARRAHGHRRDASYKIGTRSGAERSVKRGAS